MEVNQHKIMYMAAHVRMNSRTNPANWSLPELVAAFKILPEPEVSYDAWALAMGLTAVEEAPAPQMSALQKDQIDKANTNGLNAFGVRGFPRESEPEPKKKRTA